MVHAKAKSITTRERLIPVNDVQTLVVPRQGKPSMHDGPARAGDVEEGRGIVMLNSKILDGHALVVGQGVDMTVHRKGKEPPERVGRFGAMLHPGDRVDVSRPGRGRSLASFRLQ